MTRSVAPVVPVASLTADAPAAALRMPLVATGVLMAAYLALRPYGDQGATLDDDAARAFASNWWVVAHLCGVFALASLARLALRLSDLTSGVAGLVARWSGLGGLVLVLPYYGAETFGLHALGAAALDGDPSVIALADDIRNHPAALTIFGFGLLLLAVSATASAVAWQRWVGSAAGARAAWPLAICVLLFLPQFYLPAAGRVAFGAAYLLATLVWLRATTRRA